MTEPHVESCAAWQELQQEIDSYGGQKDARLKAAAAKLKAAKGAAEKARSALKAAEAALVAATAEGEAADSERAGLLQQLASTKASVAGATDWMTSGALQSSPC
jgi:structural maintenance of chromosome 2